MTCHISGLEGLDPGKVLTAKPTVVSWSLPDDTEHVDVCVVSREVNEDYSGSSVKPKVVHQFCQYDGALFFGLTEVLIVSCSTVGCQQAPVRRTLDLFLCVVGPTAEEKDSTNIALALILKSVFSSTNPCI